MTLATRIEPQEAQRKLTDWLRSRLEADDVEVSHVKVPSAGGMSAETVMFDIAWSDGDGAHEQHAVARVEPVGNALFMNYDLEREAAVMSALGEHTDVPVPEILYREDDHSILGAPFFVMERVEGEVAEDDPPFTTEGWVLELDDEQRARMCDNGLRAMAAIHGADVDRLAIPRLDTGEGGDELDRQIAGWEEFFAWAADGKDHPTIEPALKWLNDNRPSELGPVRLSWGDARLGNLLVADDQSVAAVLDWEMVGLAPPEADLAWWLFLVRHHTEGVGAPLPGGFPSREATIARYEELTGHEPANLDYWEVFAGTRLAILVLRAAHLMIAAEQIPSDSLMGLVNPATNLLAGVLDLPAPEGEADYYIGNR